MDRNQSNDFDLNRVKQEEEEPSGYYGVALTTLPVKVPGRRGRRPQKVAYGKTGEKLEKRREQNRRAAATYRKKMNSKKRSIEESYKIVVDENKLKEEECANLRAEKAHLKAILAQHIRAGCNLQGCELNNNNVQCMPNQASNGLMSGIGSYPHVTPSLGFETNFLQNQWEKSNAVTPQAVIPSRDQYVTSPYTPRSTNEQMFTFEMGKDDQNGGGRGCFGPRSFSPASSHLSVSPAPENVGPAMLPPFESMHVAMLSSEIVEDCVLEEFLQEQMTAQNSTLC